MSRSTASGEITAFWGRFFFCATCSLTNHRLEWLSNTQVRYSTTINGAVAGFPPFATVWMRANVTMSGAWTTHI
jgi:hypothetical protein